MEGNASTPRVDRFGEDFWKIFELIDSAQLSAIEGTALSLFVNCTLAPDETSRYLQERVSRESKTTSLGETLRSVLDELRAIWMKMAQEDELDPQTGAILYQRESGRCFITGRTADVRPTYIVAPSILGDRDLLPGGYLRPLLEVVLTKQKTEEMFNLLGSQKTENTLKNLILMETPVRNLFRCGYFEIVKSPYLEPPHLREDAPKEKNGGWWIRRTPPENCSTSLLPSDNELYRVPSTQDPDNCPLPAALFLRIHRIFSQQLQISILESRIEKGWPQAAPGPITLGPIGRYILRSILHILPDSIRIRLYKLVERSVDYWDNSQRLAHAKNLPFGLCLKRGRENTENEANALLLAEKYTSINAPRLIDSVMIGNNSGFILMTRIFGDVLNSVYYRTTWEERKQIGEDLAKYVAEMRRIPNQSKYLIANTLGGPVSDHRFSGQTWGPFNEISQFTDHLTREVTAPRDQKSLSLLYERKHNVVFTHSDLHMSNLFVTRGRLSGIIDWENAGFKPEYWEFTRSMWPYGGNHVSCYIYRCAFGNKYEAEYDAEVFILRNSPFVL